MNKASTMWRFLRQAEHAPPAALFVRQKSQFAHAKLIVQFFNLYLLYVIYAIAMTEWTPRTLTAQLQPLWPLFWMQFVSTGTALGGMIVAGFVLGVGTLLLPEQRLIRALFFLSFFMLATFTNSYGRISHPYHAIFLVACVLLFLPTGRLNSIAGRHHYLTVFWFAQAALAVIYSLSGFWKVYFGVQQLWAHEIGTFHPYALATLIAYRDLQTNQQSLLGWLVANHPLVGWPLHYGALYIELLSLVAVFRPVLHRLWGCAIMLFHIGTWLLMGVAFPTNMMLAGLLLVLSPFAYSASWRAIMYALPLFGDLLRLLGRASRSVSPANT